MTTTPARDDIVALVNHFAAPATQPAPVLPPRGPDLLRVRRDAQRRFDEVGLPRLTSIKDVA